eukprot:COSAG02_NODE_777_length_17301_cov_8.632310_8_plen_179_part_00
MNSTLVVDRDRSYCTCVFNAIGAGAGRGKRQANPDRALRVPRNAAAYADAEDATTSSMASICHSRCCSCPCTNWHCTQRDQCGCHPANGMELCDACSPQFPTTSFSTLHGSCGRILVIVAHAAATKPTTSHGGRGCVVYQCSLESLSLCRQRSYPAQHFTAVHNDGSRCRRIRVRQHR